MSAYAFVVSLYLRTARIRVVRGTDLGGMRVAQVLVRVAKLAPPNVIQGVRVAQVLVKYARPAFPDMHWLEDDMFLEDVVFPYNISNGSDATEMFSTNINAVDSGHEHRIGRWDQPLMSYNVAMAVRSLEDLHELKRMFRIARGPRYAFRFRDPSDYTSSFAVADEAREADPITAFDQVIGIGDGGATEFALVKTYEFGGQVSVRPIKKPEPGTVLVAVRGVELDPEDFTVDTTTGIVTLLERTPATVQIAAMTRVSTTVRRITWDGPDSLSNLRVGDYVRISGFANALNSITIGRAWEVTAISAGDATITFTVPAGTDTTYGVNETLAAEVTITPLHVPLPGFEVTAGYLFHVPVRFQEDRLPVRLEYYGGGSADVSLMEVRGDDV